MRSIPKAYIGVKPHMIKFCTLFSGSSGNCIFISTDKSKILVDAGMSLKKITEALETMGENPCELDAVLISHEHIDHIRGAGILSRKLNIPIYANSNTWNAMKSAIGNIKDENIKCFDTEEGFEIKDIFIKPFSIPHDAVEPVGFNFFACEKKVTVATDIGHVTTGLINALDESDFVLLEANHDREMVKVSSYPWNLKQRILGDDGHLSNEMAGKVVAHLAEKGTKMFMLGHLSKENNFPELAFQTVSNELAKKKIKAGTDVFLEVALRDRASSMVTLK